MRRSYNDARKQIKTAMAECSAGTAVHLQHIKALAEIDSNERAEEIALGLSPQNLGALTKTEFHYIAHVHVLPANRAEAEAIVRSQIKKETAELNYSEADEAIREQLEKDFK